MAQHKGTLPAMHESLAEALQTFPANGRKQLTAAVMDEAFAGTLSAETAHSLCQETGLSAEALMLALVPLARTYAYPPISNYFVGAVVQGESGTLIFGANLEFPGTTLNTTVHAEQAAVLYALQRGESGITAIAVNGSPCGHCRQFLTEINNPQLIVITPQIDSQPISLLLPGAFGASSLGNDQGLLDSIRHGLVDEGIDIREREQDKLTALAMTMANRSYAPYSQNYAGVALRTKHGDYFGAPYVENAAFNPSLSPLQGALVTMRMQGYDWADIEDVVLVEAKESLCSQKGATSNLLASLGAAPLRVIGV